MHSSKRARFWQAELSRKHCMALQRRLRPHGNVDGGSGGGGGGRIALASRFELLVDVAVFDEKRATWPPGHIVERLRNPMLELL